MDVDVGGCGGKGGEEGWEGGIHACLSQQVPTTVAPATTWDGSSGCSASVTGILELRLPVRSMGDVEDIRG